MSDHQFLQITQWMVRKISQHRTEPMNIAVCLVRKSKIEDLIVTRIYFSESPRHFDIIVLDDTLNKLNRARVSENKAFARALFPVP